MARRSKEEMRAEFERLSDIFEVILDFDCSRMSEAEAARKRSRVHSRERMYSWVETGKATMSEIIAGTREAINDQSEALSELLNFDDEYVSGFLAYYQRRTGRDFFEDAGNPKKIARKILKRGNIADEAEYRVLMGILNNVDQTVFKADEIDKINEMFRQFDGAHKET